MRELPDYKAVTEQPPIVIFEAYEGTKKGGHTPLSQYAEHYWMPIIGPTPYLVARRLYEMREKAFAIDIPTLAGLFGVSVSVLHKALDRLVRFGRGYWAEGAMHPTFMFNTRWVDTTKRPTARGKRE